MTVSESYGWFKILSDTALLSLIQNSVWTELNRTVGPLWCYVLQFILHF